MEQIKVSETDLLVGGAISRPTDQQVLCLPLQRQTHSIHCTKNTDEVSEVIEASATILVDGIVI